MNNSKLFYVLIVLLSFILLGFTSKDDPSSDTNLFIDDSVQEILPLLSFTDKDNPDVFQIFAHGKPGKLLIKGEWKDAASLTVWLEEVMPENIQHINIYGCNFARGARGEQAVSYLEWILNTTVAASDNITGRDGDWNLEIGNPIGAIKLNSYEGNL